MDEQEIDELKAHNRRQRVIRYMRKETPALSIKKSLNIRYMERLLGFRKGKIQKFVTGMGSLTDTEILVVYEHLKKLTRF